MEGATAAEQGAEPAVGPRTEHGPSSDQEVETTEEVNYLDSEREGQSLVDASIGLMVATIVIAQVAIPIIQDALNNSGINGTAGQVLSYVPLALALGLFVSAISIVR